MLKPDFEKYTLALIEEDKVIYSSERHGLQPLMDCIADNSKKKNLVLHDKVMGLAAAKLIVYAAIISSIFTTLVSRPAKKFLEENGIQIIADEIVENIMTRDRSAVCPGEIIAMKTKEPDVFTRQIITMLSNM